jgi:hypothetical protein
MLDRAALEDTTPAAFGEVDVADCPVCEGQAQTVIADHLERQNRDSGGRFLISNRDR